MYNVENQTSETMPNFIPLLVYAGKEHTPK